MKELYPLKFKPIYKETIWGGGKLQSMLGKKVGDIKKCGESWEISGVQENLSVVSNGYLAGNNLEELIEVYMGDIVGDKIFENYGIEFPLLIKYIDANDILSIQVHPNNFLAKERHNAYGKTEMWYIIQADKNSEIITGFNRKTSKSIYLNHLEKKSLTEILNFEQVNKGDVFFIPSGRVHAIGKGILLAEIQQTSDITYRIYDWDRKDSKGKKRELHTELALDAIDFNVYDNYRTDYYEVLNKTSSIISCDYFNTNVLHFNHPVVKDYNFLDSFVIYLALYGEFYISFGNDSEHVIMGESVLLPSSIKNLTLNPLKESKILEIYI
jgi:mannose-6-phosphate isomerase